MSTARDLLEAALREDCEHQWAKSGYTANFVTALHATQTTTWSCRSGHPMQADAIAATPSGAKLLALADAGAALRSLVLDWRQQADIIEGSDSGTRKGRAIAAEAVRQCAADLLVALDALDRLEEGQ